MGAMKLAESDAEKMAERIVRFMRVSLRTWGRAIMRALKKRRYVRDGAGCVLAKSDNDSGNRHEGKAGGSPGHPLGVAPVHHSQGDDGDKDLAQNADDQWPPTLSYQVAEVSPQTDTCKGRKKCPAGEIGEAGKLRMREETRSRQN